MPELNPGIEQGAIVPIYLVIRDIGGELVEQPPNSPTIEIVYINPETRVREDSVRTTVMDMIEPGKYFYLWYVDKNEPTVIHDLLLRGVLDGAPVEASDQSFTNTTVFENAEFYIKLNIIEKSKMCYPETTSLSPSCRARRHVCDSLLSREIDIGLDDRALEGQFRFGEFPDQVVDRRLLGDFHVRLVDPRVFHNNSISSEVPGGGPALRPNPPPVVNMRYRDRDKYRY